MNCQEAFEIVCQEIDDPEAVISVGKSYNRYSTGRTIKEFELYLRIGDATLSKKFETINELLNYVYDFKKN